VHRLQWCAFELGPGDVQLGQCAARSVEQVSARRGNDGIIADDPHVVGLGARLDEELAGELAAQPIER
jgi:hypothetical protein